MVIWIRNKNTETSFESFNPQTLHYKRSLLLRCFEIAVKFEPTITIELIEIKMYMFLVQWNFTIKWETSKVLSLETFYVKQDNLFSLLLLLFRYFFCQNCKLFRHFISTYQHKHHIYNVVIVAGENFCHHYNIAGHCGKLPNHVLPYRNKKSKSLLINGAGTRRNHWIIPVIIMSCNKRAER